MKLEFLKCPDGSCVIVEDLHQDGRLARIAEVFAVEDKETYARLFAAAPELLATCKAVLRRLTDHGMDYDARAALEAVIAKAEGHPCS